MVTEQQSFRASRFTKRDSCSIQDPLNAVSTVDSLSPTTFSLTLVLSRNLYGDKTTVFTSKQTH